MSHEPIIPKDLVSNAVFGDLHHWVTTTASRGTKLGLSRFPVSLIPSLTVKENPMLRVETIQLPAARCGYIPRKYRVSLRLWWSGQDDYQSDSFAEMLAGFSQISHRAIVMCSGNCRGISHRVLLHRDDEFGVRNLLGGAFRGLHVELEESQRFYTEVEQRMAGRLYFRHLLPIIPFWGALTGQSLHLQTIYATLMALDDDSYGVFEVVLGPLPVVWRHALQLMARAETIVASRYPKPGPWLFSRDSEQAVEEKLGGVLFAASMRTGLFTTKKMDNAHHVMTSLDMSTGGMLFNGTTLRFASETDCRRSHISPAKMRNLFLNGRVYQSGIIVSHRELASMIHFPSKEHLADKSLLLDRRPTLAANLATGPGIVLAHETIYGKEVPIIWPQRLRTMHMMISGATGLGKTVFLAGLLARIAENRKEGLAFIDPHDTGIERFVQCVPESRLDDVILHDPMDSEYVLCLPLLSCQDPDQIDLITSNVAYQICLLFTRSELGFNIVRGIKIVIRTISLCEFLSLMDVHRLLDRSSRGDALREQVCAAIQDETLLEYWQEEFPTLDRDTLRRIESRFDYLFEARRLRPYLANKICKVSRRQIITESKLFLARTNVAASGHDLARTLGSLHHTGFEAAACSGPTRNDPSPMFTIAADEFGNIANPRSVDYSLRAIRKYGVSEILATQNVEGLPEEVKIAIGNINTHVVFQQGWDDAHHYFKAFCGMVPVADFLTKGIGEGYAKIGTRFAAISSQMPDILRDVSVLEDIREMTRKKYCVPIQEFRERMIEEEGVPLDDMKNFDLL